MLALKVPLAQAQKWKEYLSRADNFNAEYRPSKDDDYIYYPIKEKFAIMTSKDNEGSIEFIDMPLEKVSNKGTLKSHLISKLSEDELEFLQTAHDTLGTIAILEIPEELEPREILIAQTLLESNPQIKTVLKKAASHEGTFRTQKMQYLAGEDTKEALYKENNVRMKLNVETVYFSPRLSNERKRIAQQVKQGEDILVMFSGCAPYPVVLSKNTPAKFITGIEINPEGHRYGLENIRLNKVKNVALINGDVKDVAPALGKTYDRIVMPLPKTADEFLDEALIVSHKGTIIHFYDFLPEDNFDDALQKIAAACKKRGLQHNVLEVVKCGQHAPHVFRICVDFVIL